jgi:hypothetical protein
MLLSPAWSQNKAAITLGYICLNPGTSRIVINFRRLRADFRQTLRL